MRSEMRLVQVGSLYMSRCRSLILGAGIFFLAAHPACAYQAYISNEKGNTVSVIDTEKLEVVKTIKVGQRPRGIAITKDGKSVVVAVGDDDTIQTIDTKSQEVNGGYPSGASPDF